MNADWSSPLLIQRLQDADILPTLQRLAVGAVILQKPTHLTAEQVLSIAHQHLPGLSRATVYSTLQLFVRRGLLRELVIDGESTVYDSNTAPHHHLYHLDTGLVEDLPLAAVRMTSLPDVGSDYELANIDVILRVRRRKPGPESHTAQP